MPEVVAPMAAEAAEGIVPEATPESDPVAADAPPFFPAAEPEADVADPVEPAAAHEAPQAEYTEEIEAAEPQHQDHEPAPHLEVVEAESPVEGTESTADISDKVDRLLEELREVT
jgi:hypothetical protein